jgi:hypothetical protein
MTDTPHWSVARSELCPPGEEAVDVVLATDHIAALAQARHEEWSVPPNRGGIHHMYCACYDDEQSACEPDECPFCACWRIRIAERDGIVKGQLSSLTVEAQKEIRRDALTRCIEVIQSFNWDVNTGMDFTGSDIIEALKGDDQDRMER